VNPAYLKEIYLAGGQKPLDPPGKKPMPRYLGDQSCFVYAPVGFLLSDNTIDNKWTPVNLTDAKKNWKESITSGIPQIFKKASPGWNTDTKNIVSSCWLYTEEFVDYVNKDRNPAHKTYESVYNKGRIGMFFRINPIEGPEHYKYLPTDDDHIGWGQIEALGKDQLQSDFVPTSWNQLQEKIGRYILLTNIWSSTDSDVYESQVDQQTLKDIYDRVYAMTCKNTIVSVRRGVYAHGRLCVVQKKIELNPQDENFGLQVTTDNKKCDLYVTQIFTARKRLTSDTANECGRMKTVTQAHEWLPNSNLSNEEKNLVAIFQNFNRKTIALMKLPAYRQVMKSFWSSRDDNGQSRRCDLMPSVGNEWKMSTMKAVLVTMILTSYNVVFNKLPGKVACRERYLRFLEIVKNYRYWFVKSKCIPDSDFVVAFERTREEEAADASQFNGMLPGTRETEPTNTENDHKRYDRPTFGDVEETEAENRERVRKERAEA
jgi:hypothetical protein